MSKLQYQLRRLRALLGAAAVLLTALAAPITLAAYTDDNICAMTCCVAEGHCCCKPARLFVKGELPKGGKSFAKTEISKSCPDECANTPSTLKIKSGDFVRSEIQVRFVAVNVRTYQPFTAERKEVYRSSSPRAPPSSILSA